MVPITPLRLVPIQRYRHQGDDKLTFTVKGDANIVAVDNGNITSDELHIGKTQLEKTILRHLFQGSALVILCAGDKPGR